MSTPNNTPSIPRFSQFINYANKFIAFRTFFLVEVAVIALLLTNTVQAATPRDPLEATNRPVVHFNMAIDTALLKPLVKNYQKTCPDLPARTNCGWKRINILPEFTTSNS